MEGVLRVPVAAPWTRVSGGHLAEAVAESEPGVIANHGLPQRQNELLCPKTRGRVQTEQSFESERSAEEGRSGINGQKITSAASFHRLESVDVSIEGVVREPPIKEVRLFTSVAGDTVPKTIRKKRTQRGRPSLLISDDQHIWVSRESLIEVGNA